MKLITLYKITFIFISLLPLSYAVDSKLKITATIVYPPTCSINNNNVININFDKKIIIKNIDGVNYKKNINFDINCGNSQKDWDLYLTIKGEKSSLDDAALVVPGFDNLAIKMEYFDSKVIINEKFKISKNNPIILTAVPIKSKSSDPKPGLFMTQAVLLAEYL